MAGAQHTVRATSKRRGGGQGESREEGGIESSERNANGVKGIGAGGGEDERSTEKTADTKSFIRALSSIDFLLTSGDTKMCARKKIIFFSVAVVLALCIRCCCFLVALLQGFSPTCKSAA